MYRWSTMLFISIYSTMYTSRVSCRRRWRTHNSQFSVARMPCSAMKAIAAAEDTQSYIIGYNISRQHIRNACVSWLPVVKTEYRLDVVCRYFLRMFYERFANTKLHCCVFYNRTNHIRVKIKLSPNSTRNSFIYVTNNVAGHIVRKHQKVMSILYILPLSCDRGGAHFKDIKARADFKIWDGVELDRRQERHHTSPMRAIVSMTGTTVC